VASAFCEVVGCRIPIQLAGMGGVGSPALAAAVARGGGVGMLPLLAAEPVGHRLAEARAAAGDGVLGVNVLLPFFAPPMLDAALEARPALVECFFGAPDAAVVEAIHAGGALAGWQVGTAGEALDAAAAGCDLVVVQGVEAGGHVRGTTPLHTLLAEVRDALGPAAVLVGAGGMANGADVAAALAAGADAVRLGTRFLLTPEADVHPSYQAALQAAEGDATVLTTAFGLGWPDAPHRVLRRAVDAAERLPEGSPGRWSPMPPARDATGDVDAMALYAGTGVNRMHEVIPAEELVHRLWGEATA